MKYLNILNQCKIGKKRKKRTQKAGEIENGGFKIKYPSNYIAYVWTKCFN